MHVTASPPSRAHTRLSCMRRSFQIVALLAAALLAVPPAVANAFCSSAHSGGEPAAFSCCAGTPGNLSDMESAACSTPRHAALETFASGAHALCAMPAPPVLLARAIEGNKIIAAPSTMTVANAVLLHGRSEFAPPGAETLPAPSKYLLFRVFRI